MIDVEKLLGKVVGEMVGADRFVKGKKKKKNRSVLDSLGSGAGLMTVIGLGVGAYEIFKDRSPQTAPTTVAGGLSGRAVPPPPPGTPAAPPPPPIAGTTFPPPPPQGARGQAGSTVSGMPSAVDAPAVPEEKVQDLALRMMQVMIAAAHCDGVMDEAEEKRILDRLRAAELSREERMFLITELHRPHSIEALTDGVEDMGVARTMYMLAAAAIDVDTAAERQWLDQLSAALGISREVAKFLEEEP